MQEIRNGSPVEADLDDPEAYRSDIEARFEATLPPRELMVWRAGATCTTPDELAEVMRELARSFLVPVDRVVSIEGRVAVAWHRFMAVERQQTKRAIDANNFMLRCATRELQALRVPRGRQSRSSRRVRTTSRAMQAVASRSAGGGSSGDRPPPEGDGRKPAALAALVYAGVRP